MLLNGSLGVGGDVLNAVNPVVGASVPLKTNGFDSDDEPNRLVDAFGVADAGKIVLEPTTPDDGAVNVLVLVVAPN